MKKHLIILLFAIIGVVGYAKIIDMVIAVVEGRPILLSEFRERYEAYKELLKYPKSVRKMFLDEDISDEKTLKKRVLDDIINDAYIDYIASLEDVEVMDDEIERELEAKRLSMRLSKEQFEKEMAKAGKSIDEYKKELKKLIMRQKLIRKKFAREVLKPTEIEAKMYYEKHRDEFVIPRSYKIGRLTIMIPKNAGFEIIKRKDKIADKAEKLAQRGYDFAKLVKRYSSLKDEKDREGLWGIFPMNKIKKLFGKELGKIILSMKKGDVKKIDTPDGYLILKILDIIPKRDISFDKAKGIIIKKLYVERIMKKFKKWLSLTKRLANIKVFVKIDEI